MDEKSMQSLDVPACLTSLIVQVSSKVHGLGDSIELMPQ